MNSAKSLLGNINEKVIQGKQPFPTGSNVYVNTSIDRFNLRAKNYYKQEKTVILIQEECQNGQDEVSVAPAANLIGRIYIDSAAIKEQSKQGELVS